MPRQSGQKQGCEEGAKKHTGHHIGYVVTIIYEPAHMKETDRTIVVNIFASVYQYALVQDQQPDRQSNRIPIVEHTLSVDS
jgi:hypothetical protein